MCQRYHFFQPTQEHLVMSTVSPQPISFIGTLFFFFFFFSSSTTWSDHSIFFIQHDFLITVTVDLLNIFVAFFSRPNESNYGHDNKYVTLPCQVHAYH